MTSRAQKELFKTEKNRKFLFPRLIVLRIPKIKTILKKHIDTIRP